MDVAIAFGSANDLVVLEESTLDVAEHESWKGEHRAKIELVARQQSESICSLDLYQEFVKPYVPPPILKPGITGAAEPQTVGDRVKAQIPRMCFRCDVAEGDPVEEGTSLVSFPLLRPARCLFYLIDRPNC